MSSKLSYEKLGPEMLRLLQKAVDTQAKHIDDDIDEWACQLAENVCELFD